MGDEQWISVTVHLSAGWAIPKTLWPGATIWDLKEELAHDDPTGKTRPEEFHLGCLPAEGSTASPLPDASPIGADMTNLVICTPGEAVVPAAQEEQWPAEPEVPPEPCEYRVTQGRLLKKPGADPATPKVVLLKRKVASTVKTTGRTWNGPAGGEWVELDPEAEKPGWLLVEGPGFDVKGALLEKVEPGEEPPMVLSCYSAVSKTTVCQVCVKPSQTIKHVQAWIQCHCPHAQKLMKIWCVKAEPEDADGSHFLKTFNSLPQEVVLESEGFKDGGTVVFVIIGSSGEFC